MEHARPPTDLVLEGGPAARAEAWRKWRKQFNVFLKASGVSSEPAGVQASLLVNLIGPAGYEVYSTFTLTEKEDEDLESILKKFDSHFGTKPNVTVARYKFFNRNQEDGENIDQWVTSLRLLSQSCEFGELTEGLIRDRIVCGILNNTVRDRLLRTDELTLARAVQICQAAEMSHEEGRCIEGAHEVRVDAVRGAAGRASGSGYGSWGRAAAGGRRRASSRRGARRGARQPAASPRQPCAACGSSACAGDQQCSARGATCYVCEKVGHFAKVCPFKQVIRNQVCDLAVDDSDDEGGTPSAPQPQPQGLIVETGSGASVLQLPATTLEQIRHIAADPGASTLRLPPPAPEPPAGARELDLDLCYVCKHCKVAFPAPGPLAAHQARACYAGREAARGLIRVVQPALECRACPGERFRSGAEFRRHADSEAHRHAAPPPAEPLTREMEDVVNQITLLAARAAQDSAPAEPGFCAPAPRFPPPGELPLASAQH